MFSSFTARLRSEIETVKSVLATHDLVREVVFRDGGSDDPTSDTVTLKAIRQIAPPKSNWQVYDHCAAFTRLYAVFESFIDELATEYIRLLPSLYSAYKDLPTNVATQHRIGIAQILLKIGKNGPFQHLDENRIIADLAKGIEGAGAYTLLKDAFLLDPRNYRAEIIDQMFAALGIEQCWSWVESYPPLVEFMETRRDQTESARTLLHDLVEYRNEAAHTLITETAAADEFRSIADFVVLVAEALSHFVMKRVVRRREEIGEATHLGDIIHRFSNNIVGVRGRSGKISIGDIVVIIHKRTCRKARVISIQVKADVHDELNLAEDQEFGLKLSCKGTEGARIIRLKEDDTAMPKGELEELISPDVELDAHEAPDRAGESADESES